MIFRIEGKMKKKNGSQNHLLGIIFIIILLIVGFFFYRFYLTVSIPKAFGVGERSEHLSREAKLNQALKAANLSLRVGDQPDRQGKLLKKGRGNSPVVLLNGVLESLARKLQEGDSSPAYPREYLNERLLKKFEVVPSTLIQGGWGAFISIQRGNPGLKEITFGEKSGIIMGERMVRLPTETKIKGYNISSSKLVALTFDDGPYYPYTSQILNILKEKQTPATFFVVGEHIEKYPKVLAEVAYSGYDIGNHTYSHTSLSQASYEQIVQELDQNENLIAAITGKRTHWFRPPGGNLSTLLINTVIAKGYNFVLWNVDVNDWKHYSSARIQKKVLEKVKPGAVILLHDGGGNQSATVAALPGIIDGLKTQGFSCVSLDELYAAEETPTANQLTIDSVLVSQGKN
ncbi:polysaccharide deacetylase family protein [Candidatus Poribacteria bacterium]|nr:polysaccharide deacetylase family protein [Candidatus Poribacteria bacterium]